MWIQLIIESPEGKFPVGFRFYPRRPLCGRRICELIAASILQTVMKDSKTLISTRTALLQFPDVLIVRNSLKRIELLDSDTSAGA